MTIREMTIREMTKVWIENTTDKTMAITDLGFGLSAGIRMLVHVEDLAQSEVAKQFIAGGRLRLTYRNKKIDSMSALVALDDIQRGDWDGNLVFNKVEEHTMEDQVFRRIKTQGFRNAMANLVLKGKEYPKRFQFDSVYGIIESNEHYVVACVVHGKMQSRREEICPWCENDKKLLYDDRSIQVDKEMKMSHKDASVIFTLKEEGTLVGFKVNYKDRSTDIHRLEADKYIVLGATDTLTLSIDF